MVLADRRKLKLGMIGIAQATIEAGKTGYVDFQTGEADPVTGHRLYETFEVQAYETVRAKRDVIICDDQLRIKEHTPVEINYELKAGGFQRVGEVYPLPVTMGAQSKTSKPVVATAADVTLLHTPSQGKKVRVHYVSYSNADASACVAGLSFKQSPENSEIHHRFSVPANGGAINANLTDCPLDGETDQSLYVHLDNSNALGLYVTVVVTER